MTVEETNNYSRYRWLLHILIVSYFLMGFIVRFSWPPLASVASQDLGMDMTAAGSYMSAFYIGYVLVQIPAGIFGDRFGGRGVILLALFIEGAASIGMTFIESYSVGFLLRIVAGLGAGMVYSACVRSIILLFPPKEQGLAFGVFYIAPVGGGVLLTNLLMPWLASFWTWREAFVVVGAMAFCLFAAAFFTLRDSGAENEEKDIFGGVKFILRNRALMLLCVAGFCQMWSQISFVSWGNSYLKTIGFSLVDSGLIMMVFGVGGCLGPLAAGLVCPRAPHPKWVIAFSLAAVLVTLPGFCFSTDIYSLMLSAGVVGFFFGAANTPINVIISLFAGKERSATASGVFGFIAQPGAIFGPLLIGFSIDLTGGYTGAWWMIAGGCALGSLLLAFIPHPARD